MRDDVGVSELFRFVQKMDERLNEDAKEIKDHLRALNGRTGKLEVTEARNSQRLTNLEHEIYKRPRRRQADQDADRPRSRRKAAAAGAAIVGLLLGLLEGLHQLVDVAKVWAQK